MSYRLSDPYQGVSNRRLLMNTLIDLLLLLGFFSSGYTLLALVALLAERIHRPWRGTQNAIQTSTAPAVMASD